jgi:CheY-like chemotaxis protein
MKRGERKPAHRERRVLVVDDEPDIRELLELTLAKMGLAVAAVGTLAEARERLREGRFDLCLTDMRLPDGEGLDLVRHISGLGDELPTRRMLLASAAELAPVAQRIVAALTALGGFEAATIDAESQPGSGSAPTVFLPTTAVRVKRSRTSAEALAAQLRAGDPPVFTRVQDDALLLDPRALLPGDEQRLVDAFRALAAHDRR